MGKRTHYCRHADRYVEDRAVRNGEPRDFIDGVNKNWAKAREHVYSEDPHFEGVKAYLGETITTRRAGHVDPELCSRILDRNPRVREVFDISKERGEYTFSDLGYFGAHLKLWIIKHRQGLVERGDVLVDMYQESGRHEV